MGRHLDTDENFHAEHDVIFRLCKVAKLRRKTLE